MPTIREARADDFPRVYALLLEFNNRGLTREHWRQLFVDHSGFQKGRFGWVLVEGEDVVGFVSTIFSERKFRGETVRLCNTSSWIVKQEYRAHSLALHDRVVADKSLTVTNLSPTPQVLKLLEKMGFTLMDKTERIILPVVTPGMFTRRCQVLTGRDEVWRALDGEALRFFRDHHLPYNHHVLLRAPEGDCYVMLNRSPKAVGRVRLPFGRIHYVSAPEMFVRYLEAATVRIAVALKVVALMIDDRMLGGARPWHSFLRPGGERKAAFRSTKLTADDIDGLYTEAVLLNY